MNNKGLTRAVRQLHAFVEFFFLKDIENCIRVALLLLWILSPAFPMFIGQPYASRVAAVFVKDHCCRQLPHICHRGALCRSTPPQAPTRLRKVLQTTLKRQNDLQHNSFGAAALHSKQREQQKLRYLARSGRERYLRVIAVRTTHLCHLI